MILIKNRQRKIAVDVAQLERDTQTLLDALGYSDFDIGILLTTNATIRKYNREYRDKDKATDILSFPYHTELPAGQSIKVETEDDKNLGDLIISLEYVYNDAQNYDVTFEKRMQELLVHGICHLLGHDHIEDADYETMHKKEMQLLALIAK
ncbi:MAG TPA: rRNA maturation RNase YbeY [Candidatus Babeliales bacterium]|nr:rRNA maturation RNase YbeY [Candidatus Babeliales bacterium]